MTPAIAIVRPPSKLDEEAVGAVLSGRVPAHVVHCDWRTLVTMLSDGSIDHLVTDPPYEADAHTKQRRVKKRGIVIPKPLPFAPIADSDRCAIAREAGRIIRRWSIAFCQTEAAHKWIDAFGAAGIAYRRTCAWVKPDGAPQFSGDRPAAGYEALVCCHARGRSRWNGGGRRGVFVHSTSDMGRREHLHPTQKPLPLMLDLIELFTDPGDVVLDPFAGSGTTGVACLRLGRRFLGCEVDATFVELARKRLDCEARGASFLSAQVGQTSIFDLLEGGHATPHRSRI